jgi:DNA replication protein DnaC
VVSLVDRLMHRAEVVRIEGESYRQKEAEERAAQRAAARSAAARTKPASIRKPRA